VPHVEAKQELLTHSELPSSTPSYQWGSCCLIFNFLCSVLQVIVILFLFFWPLHCLSFVDLWLLVTPLISPKLSFLFHDFHDIRWWSCRSRVQRRVPLAEQELLTFRSTGWTPDCCGVDVAQSLVFCVVHSRSIFVFVCPFYFGHCMVCPYGFW